MHAETITAFGREWRRAWQEDEMLLHDPDVEHVAQAWVRVVGTPYPGYAGMPMEDWGDTLVHHVGDAVVLNAYDGHSIYLPATVVVNLRDAPYDVYIGRAGHGEDGYFGNPFKDGTREENIAKFREWFWRRVNSDREYARCVSQLRGKRLGCFCKPLPCHGDVIAAWLDAPDDPDYGL